IFESTACKVMLSFREDFLADVKRLSTLVTSTDRNAWRLEPMRWSDAVTAVRLSGGALLAPPGGAGDVAAAIVSTVAGQPRDVEHAPVEPAIMSVFCRELNEERKARRDRGESAIIDLALVQGRDASAIIARFYRRAVADVPMAVRQFIENRLTLPSG